MISKAFATTHSMAFLLMTACVYTASLSGCCTYGYNCCPQPYCAVPGQCSIPLANYCDPCQFSPVTPSCQCQQMPAYYEPPAAYCPIPATTSIPELWCDDNPCAMPQSYSYSAITHRLMSHYKKAKRFVPTPKRPSWLTRSTFDPTSYIYSDDICCDECSLQLEGHCTDEDCTTTCVEPACAAPTCAVPSCAVPANCAAPPACVAPVCAAPFGCAPATCHEEMMDIEVDAQYPTSPLPEPERYVPGKVPAPAPVPSNDEASLNKRTRQLSPALAQFATPKTTSQIHTVSHQFPDGSQSTGNAKGKLLVDQWQPAKAIR